MAKLAELEAQVIAARAGMARIDRAYGEITDEEIEEYLRLEAVAKDTEALIADERVRLRQNLDLSRELRPPERSGLEHGTAILAGQPRDYTRLYGAPQASSWKPGEFMATMLHGRWDSRLQMLSAMGESEGSGGGFAVPQELERRVLDQALHASIVLARANLSVMTSRQKLVAGFSATDQSNSMYGFTVQFLAEHEEATVGTGLVRAILLTANTVGAYTGASIELLSDASGFEADLVARMGEAVGQALDGYFISGNGAGVPLGYLRSGALLQVAKEVAQPGATISTMNILDMISHATDVNQSVWVCNPSCLPQLGTLTFSVGPTIAPSVLLTPGTDGQLLLMSRPVLFTHKAPILGQIGDITLCNFSSYVCGMRQGIVVQSSPAPGYLKREMTFACLTRVDGQPLVNTVYLGQDGRSYSPFVCLQART